MTPWKDYDEDELIDAEVQRASVVFRGVVATIGIAAIGLVLLGVVSAWAHQTKTGMKFDGWCCNGNTMNGDCQEIPGTAVKQVGNTVHVTLKPGDHPLVTKPHEYTMERDKVRRSTDGLYYACLFPTENFLRCLYLPPDSF